MSNSPTPVQPNANARNKGILFGVADRLYRYAHRVYRLAALVALAALVGPFLASVTTAQTLVQNDEPPSEYTPVRTDSPRETFQSFQRLSGEMEAALVGYIAAPSFAGVSRLALLSDQMNGLIDLDAVPASSRRETGIRTMTYLMDIFGRLPPIDPALMPDAEELEAEGLTAARIPGTPLYIAAVTEGPRTGEHLFVGAAVDIAPRFFRSVDQLPLRTDLPVRSFTNLGPQLTGPLIPPAFVAAMPPRLRTLWLDTPAWKVLISVTAAVALLIIAITLHRAVGSIRTDYRVLELALKAILPITLVFVANLALPAFTFQVNVSGRFADVLGTFKTALAYLSYAWLYWLLIRLVFEAIILSPRIPDASLDANLLRLVSNVIGLVGAVVILAFGGQAIGLPVLSVLAGLGIGGLAVALALRPTLENLVGGVILYIDRPVRVGDFCAFGDKLGTIEAIGVRSTKLRALNRTLISVPNAQLADMQITNYAYCDRMLIHEKIGVRYETTPDQMRYLLASIRKMLHAHPRIDRETVRVRFAGYGDSSLDLDMRIYVNTREWNDFFAVREDVYLRLYDLVTEAGSSFAFPSQTVYFGRDSGLEADRGKTAEEAVSGWRRRGKLPFPSYSSDELDAFEGKLDYPPRGSVMRDWHPEETPDDGDTEDGDEDRGQERLSSEGTRTLPGKG